MKTRSYPMLIGVVFAVSMAALAAGCNRESHEAVAVAEPAVAKVDHEIDDTLMNAKVMSALLGDEDIKSFEIQVKTRKRLVRLSGIVGSQAQIDRAVAVATCVEGVKGIESRMTVKDGNATTGDQLGDSVITTKAKTALLVDSGANSGSVTVVTSKGEAQWNSFVDSQAQIKRATMVARDVKSTQGVVNGMSFKK